MISEEHEKSEEDIIVNPSLADVWKVLAEIKANTQKLFLDVETLKGNYKDLKESLKFTQNQVESLLKENKNLKEVNRLEEDYEEMEQRLSDLESKQDDIERYTCKFNLEIHGIAKNEKEDPSESIIKIGELTGAIVNRMQRKGRNLPRPIIHIIVRFRSYGIKSKLYSARRYLRKSDFSIMGSKSIFINENLTTWRAGLFTESRKKQKQKYPGGKAWTVDGKIYIKANSSTKARRIDSYGL